jgi:ligand-binding sensor domain-containing protein
MLQAADGGLLIGTSEGIWFDPVNGTLKKLSSSPVPNHTATVTDREGTVWFWTDEGLAKAMPFEEVTVDRLDPGAASQVSLGLVKDTRGDKIVVITKV